MSRCAPIRFLFGSVLRDAVLSSPTDTLGELNYLHYEHRDRFCQFDRDDTVVIEASLLRRETLDTLALAHHNFSPFAIIRVEVTDFAGNVTTREFNQNTQLEIFKLSDFLSGVISMCGNELHQWPDPLCVWLDEVVQPAKVRITISDPKNPDGYIKLGMLLAGEYVKIHHNFSYGHELTPITAGEIGRLKSGYAVRRKIRRAVKNWRLSLDHMIRADRMAIQTADEAAMNQPVLVSGFPAGDDWEQETYNFIALTEGDIGYSHQYHGSHSVPLTFAEV